MFYRFAITVLCLCGVAVSPVASAVVLDGREWRQLDETLSLSWNELDSIFDTGTGLLDTASTTLNGIDFAGWTWASINDIGAMYAAAGLPDCTVPTVDPCTFTEINSTWAPAFVDNDGAGVADTGLFNATELTGGRAVVQGWARDTSPAGVGQAIIPFVQDSFSNLETDYRSTAPDRDKASASAIIGTWLFREVAVEEGTVPVPHPFLLLLPALGYLWWTRRTVVAGTGGA